MRYDFIKSFKTKFYILAISAILNVIVMIVTEAYQLAYLVDEQQKLLNGAYSNVTIDVELYVLNLGNIWPFLLLPIEAIVVSYILSLHSISDNLKSSSLPPDNSNGKSSARRKLFKTLSIIVGVIVILYTALLAFIDLASIADLANELSEELRLFNGLSEIESVDDILSYFVGASKGMIWFLAVELVMVVMLVWLKSKSMSISHIENLATSA